MDGILVNVLHNLCEVFHYFVWNYFLILCTHFSSKFLLKFIEISLFLVFEIFDLYFMSYAAANLYLRYKIIVEVL